MNNDDIRAEHDFPWHACCLIAVIVMFKFQMVAYGV